MTTALVIGAGPAGLMAADTLSAAGVQVIVAEKMPSAGRKFLMAGKSGLNMTKAESLETFVSHYYPKHEPLLNAVRDFGPEIVQAWARSLGQELFTGSTSRVFPSRMKASPLLRAWLHRLAAQGVILKTRWTWTGWDGAAVKFETPDGPQALHPDITVLALGGASWARLGSDGAWAAHFDNLAPFQPANMGFKRRWSVHMSDYIGKPVKGIALKAGALSSRGEIILSREGIEGGGIYEVARTMREGNPLTIDLVPDLDRETVLDRWSKKRTKGTISRFLKSGLRLSPIKVALFNEVMHKAMPQLADEICQIVKALPLSHDGPRPMDQAISTAGGIPFSMVTNTLMLKDRPGVFCAGEMLDWEAPTGGYLITGCLATGHAAAKNALIWRSK